VTPTAQISDSGVKAAAEAAGADGAWRATNGGKYLALVWRVFTGLRPGGFRMIVR